MRKSTKEKQDKGVVAFIKRTVFAVNAIKAIITVATWLGKL